MKKILWILLIAASCKLEIGETKKKDEYTVEFLVKDNDDSIFLNISNLNMNGGTLITKTKSYQFIANYYETYFIHIISNYNIKNPTDTMVLEQIIRKNGNAGFKREVAKLTMSQDYADILLCIKEGYQ